MTAYDFEYTFIKNEGVEFRFFSQPVRVVGENGRVMGLECLRVEPGPPGLDGRALPQPVVGSEFIIPCDQVVKAIGQEKLIDLYAQFDLELERGYVKVDAGRTHLTPQSLCGRRLHPRDRRRTMTVTATEDGSRRRGAFRRG